MRGTGSKGLRPGDLAQTVKLFLCLQVSLSAVFGFVLAEGRLSGEAGLLGISVLLLALGSAALNNVQDREPDAGSPRTRHRAIPSGRLKAAPVFGTALISMLAGEAGLFFFFDGPVPALCGVFAVICYNGLYTPLKRYTFLALGPGVLSGMMPPLIGWTAAGAPVSSPKIIAVMIILGVWQIPHFLLVGLKSRPCRGAEAGEKDATYGFSGMEFRLVVMIWCALYSLAMMFYLVKGHGGTLVFSAVIFLNAVSVLLWTGTRLFHKNRERSGQAFAGLNLSLVVFMAAGMGSALV